MIRVTFMAKLLARVFQFAAASLAIPGLVALGYGDGEAWSYAATAVLALGVGGILFIIGRASDLSELSHREGFLAVVVSWVVLIVLGTIPFWISGAIPSLIDAFFESASGYSTTGATILNDIEALGHGHLFQRSLAHWIGGMGIIVLSVAILPDLAVGGMQLFSAESSGISTDKLSPRIVSTARRLWQIYAGLSLVLAVLLRFGGMNWFDAVTHSFGTLATGGFSPKNASIAAYGSFYIEAVITVFMLLSGMSFALHYRMIVRRQFEPLLRSAEVGVYFGIYFVFTAVIAATLVNDGTYLQCGTALRASAFQVASILTTTGYATADFDRWPDLCRYLLVVLMFVGGCAGSTAGGVKVVRVLLVFRHAVAELRRLLYPTAVIPVTIGGRAVPVDTIRAMLGFFLLYIMTTLVAATLVVALGMDLVSGVTAVISAMNSIGPGLGTVGPASNFSDVPSAAKLILSFCMVVGRLEIYTVFVLFTAAFWRR